MLDIIQSLLVPKLQSVSVYQLHNLRSFEGILMKFYGGVDYGSWMMREVIRLRCRSGVFLWISAYNPGFLALRR